MPLGLEEDMRAVAIHLVEGYGKIEQIDRQNKIYESGDWKVSESTAAELVGGRIYLHSHQSDPSFFGGSISAYRKIEEGENAGRIIFTFQSLLECKDVTTSKAGWGREKKIVKEESQPEN